MEILFQIYWDTFLCHKLLRLLIVSNKFLTFKVLLMNIINNIEHKYTKLFRLMYTFCHECVEIFLDNFGLKSPFNWRYFISQATLWSFYPIHMNEALKFVHEFDRVICPKMIKTQLIEMRFFFFYVHIWIKFISYYCCSFFWHF